MHGENAPVLYGASARRKCRDVFFALLFVAFWVGMGIVAYLAVQNGDLRRFSYFFSFFFFLFSFLNIVF